MMIRAVLRAAATKQTSAALPKISAPLIASIVDERREKQNAAGGALIYPVHGRALHTTAQSESTVLVVGLGVAGVATAAIYGLKAYEKYAQAKADAAPPPAADGSEPAAEEAPTAKATTSEAPKAGAKDSAKPAGAASSGGGGIFGAQAFARRFYKGGFEDRMTRREAALILGVRESAEPSRIRDRHRKMLMNNHPDTGGSTFIATKINEAKDVLIKGKASS